MGPFSFGPVVQMGWKIGIVCVSSVPDHTLYSYKDDSLGNVDYIVFESDILNAYTLQQQQQQQPTTTTNNPQHNNNNNNNNNKSLPALVTAASVRLAAGVLA
jgi:hypothetical protein